MILIPIPIPIQILRTGMQMLIVKQYVNCVFVNHNVMSYRSCFDVAIVCALKLSYLIIMNLV